MVVSFERFMDKLYFDDRQIELMTLKKSRFSTGLNLDNETKRLRALVEQQTESDRLLKAITSLHEGREVEVYGVDEDPEKKDRAFFLHVRSQRDEKGERVSENLNDIRLLLSLDGSGQDRLNDAGYSAIAREVGIPTYGIRTVMHARVRTK
jgi:hypothetical protein